MPLLSPVPFRFPVPLRDRAVAVVGSFEGLVRGLANRLASRSVGLDRPAWESWLETFRFQQGALEPASERLVAPRQPVLFFGALPWSFRRQRPQLLALALARMGHPTLYVESFRRQRIQPPHQAWRPGPEPLLVLKVRVPGRPDPYREPLVGPAAAVVAEGLAAGIASQPVLIVVQLPHWTEVALALQRQLESLLIYDRIDLHTEFAGVPPVVGEVERRLVAGADLVTNSSELLCRRSVVEGSRRSVLVRNGFEPAPALAGGGRGERAPSRPRVGYVGALSDWFDAAALATAAGAMPDVDFVLAGRVECAAVRDLGALPNVQLLGELPHAAVPALLATFAGSVIPFVDSELTRAVDPVKLYEALAAGLPVVARRLPEVARWQEPAVYLYDDSAPMVPALRRALAEDSAAHREVRRRLVLGDTWTARAEELVAAVAEVRMDEATNPAENAAANLAGAAAR